MDAPANNERIAVSVRILPHTALILQIIRCFVTVDTDQQKGPQGIEFKGSVAKAPTSGNGLNVSYQDGINAIEAIVMWRLKKRPRRLKKRIHANKKRDYDLVISSWQNEHVNRMS